MKKIKIVLYILLLSQAAALCIGNHVSASTEGDWKVLYTQNFEGMSDEAVLEENIPEIKTSSNFSAQVKNEALEIKSDNMSYNRVDVLPSSPAEAKEAEKTNAHGITVNDKFFAERREPFQAGDYMVHFQAGTDVSVYYDEIEGKGGRLILWYARMQNGEWVARRTTQRYTVQSDIFEGGAQNYDVEIKYYYKTDDTAADSRKNISFYCLRASDSTMAVSRNISDGEVETNKWATWRFRVSDTDLTKLQTPDDPSSSTADWFNMMLTTSDATSKDTEIYINSISVKKAEKDPADFSKTSRNKTVALPLWDGAIEGNTKLEFDMLLPSDAICNDAEDNTVKYNSNSQDNAMRVSLADENRLDLATIEIDTNSNSQVIYAISSDSSGSCTKRELYAGNILDKTLTYTYELNWIDKTYHVLIQEGDTVIAEDTDIPVNNYNIAGDRLYGKYLTVKHDPYSCAAMSLIDNIVLETKEDEAYVEARKALDALSLGIKGQVNTSFSLPVICGSDTNRLPVVWKSDNSAITIETAEDAAIAVVACGEAAVKVTLTASVTVNGLTATRDFVIAVAEDSAHAKAAAEIDGIKLEVPISGRLTDDFELPLKGSINNLNISWKSSNSNALVIDGGMARVMRAENDMPVTLTASVTVGKYTVTREFELVVASLENVYAQVGDISVRESGGKLSASVTVKYPMKKGNISFVAVAQDSNGKIRDRKVDTKVINEDNKYFPLTFSVEELNKLPTDKVRYYIWDDAGTSFINNAPTAVKEFSAVGKVMGVGISWTDAVDDNNAIEYYAIYRDDKLLDIVSGENYYLDRDAVVGTEYNYRVSAVDTNGLAGAADMQMKCSPIVMDYIRYGKDTCEVSQGMEVYPFNSDSARDAYAFITEVVDANGERCYAASTTSKNVMCRRPQSYNHNEGKEYTIEITYLDTQGDIQVIYKPPLAQGMSETEDTRRTSAYIVSNMGGTNLWKTAQIRITDASFRWSLQNSGCDFCFHPTIANQLFLKEVKVIEAELYE